MQSEQPVWVLQSKAGGDAGSPVAAGGDEPAISQSLHQLCPCPCYPVHAPARSRRPATEAVPGQRWHHKMEVVAVRRARQPFHRLLEFEERPGPPVGKDEWHRFRGGGGQVEIVNGQAVDLGLVLRPPVKPAFCGTPVMVG